MTSQSSDKPEQRGYTVQRKQPIIFWVFIVIAIPALLFVGVYSAGYRYNKETRSLTRTAAISLISTPKNATVSLNSEVQAETTPYIKTASAGAYRITVSKPGYHTWEKQTTITPGKSIVFPDIVLFYSELTQKPFVETRSLLENSLEITKIDTVTEAASKLANAERILSEQGFSNIEQLQVITGGPKLLLVDPKAARTYVLKDINDTDYTTIIDGAITDATWIDKNTLLYASGTDLWLYQLDPKNMDLIARVGTPITSVGAHSSGQYFYYTTNAGLYAVEYDSRDRRQTWTLLSAQNIFIDHIRNNGRTIVTTNTQDPTATATKNSIDLYEADTFLQR